MSDIVERINDALGQDTFWDTDAVPLLTDAVAEIKQLRLELSVQKACTVASRDEIARLRLTNEEREAIEFAVEHLQNSGWGTATLRNLLERLHT